jgi:hypothetical protein
MQTGLCRMRTESLAVPSPRAGKRFSDARDAERKEIEAAAQAIGQQLLVLDLSGDRDIESAFETAFSAGPVLCSLVPARS